MSQVNYQNVEIRQQENIVLEEVNLQVQEGEFVYLIGKVGSGKSSLLKTMYGELDIHSGNANVLDYDMARIRRKQIPALRKRIGIVFQDFQLLIDRNVRDNLDFVLKATGWNDKGKRTLRIEEVLEQGGMSTKGYKMPHELSGGEQQRTALAKVLLTAPDILLLDEPTAALSPAMTKKMVGLIRRLVAERKLTIALIEHNMGVVRELADYIYFLHEGTVHTHGTQKDVLENPAVRELYMGLSGGMAI